MLYLCLFACRLADLNLQSHALSSISVSDCGALHRISIVSSSVKVFTC